MSDKPSEEKSEQASDKKLKKAREQGDIARSQVFVSACATLGGVVALWFVKTGLSDRASITMSSLLTLKDLGLGQAITFTRDVLTGAVLPIFLGSVLASLGGNFLTNKGFTLSMEKIKPNLKNIGFSSYRQRTFSSQGLANLVEIMIVFLLLLLEMVLMAYYFRRDFFKIFSCGLDCGFDFFFIIMSLYVAMGMTFVLVVALVDLKLQSVLYLKRQRSTKTEAKKEMKEEMGEPHIRQERKRLHQDAAAGGHPDDKMNRTSFCLHHRDIVAVSIGYVSLDGHNQFFVIESGVGAIAQRLLASARQHDKFRLDAPQDFLTALHRLGDEAEISDPQLLLRLSKIIMNATKAAGGHS